ncbi:Uncharacterized metal-binding protein YceD, DUF177 family [Saccharicrinis carchari]|uniref:Uncharacterized metal-binding protein YceD, DUF177 family n=1 Tax=Saccharicrinis carchari TaxID=1168039 RepID=A0A521BWH8_SACCC|nr:DUF177 domain-containing protein [Saccharicrinis carchari]SMO51543.1 Uncharacterized metal-binding protein YceD, DUF177 family [Saccharicrinis carchari]
MYQLQEYNINFKSLKDGKHHFHFSIGQLFFKAVEESIIADGDFEIEVELDKKTQMLQLDFNIHGSVKGICDNCLGALTVPVSYQGAVYVKFGIEYDESNEEVIVLPQDESKINIAHLIYEYIVVSMPLRSVHEDYKSCDPEMKARLEEFSGEYHHNDSKEEEITDPRWDALKKLKYNNNK